MNQKIQVLRGLSVTAVILYHFSPQMFPNGYLGVDIFFVISGFVIAPSIERIFTQSGTNLRRLILNSFNFIVARFERLAPTLTIVVIATSIIGVFALPIGVSQGNLFSQALASIGLYANIGAYKTQGDYFAPTQLPLLHTWSLSAEQQIYIFLPLFLIVVNLVVSSRLFKNFFIYFYSVFLFASIILFAALSYLADQNLISGTPLLGELIYYSPTTRIIEFLIGALLTRLKLGKLRPQTNGIAYMGICVLLFISRQFLNVELFLAFAIIFPLSALLICSNSQNSTLITNRVFTYLGDKSYSLYLWHLPILVYLAELTKFRRVSAPFLACFSLILILGLAHLSHSGVEVKLRIYLRSLSRKKSATYLSVYSILLPLSLLISLQWLNGNNYLMDQRSRTEYASTLDKNCQRDGTDVPEPCHYNSSEPNSILLFGDSYAGAISQVVIDSSQKLGYSTFVWTQGGCPVLNPNSPSEIFIKFATYPEACRMHNMRVLDFVKKMRPEVVVISQRSERISTKGKAFSDFRQSFEEYLNLLKVNTKKIVYVGPTPVFPESLYSHYIFQDKKQTITLRSELNQSSFFENMLYREISMKLEIQFLNPIPVFCSLSVCYHKDTYGEYFTDGAHLSVYGASKLFKSFESLIRSI